VRASHATVVSYIALFVALATGGAYAAGIGRNEVGSKQIIPKSVRASDIAASAVKTKKVADAAITTPKIAPGAVGAGQIAAGAVGADQIAAGAVGSTQIAPAAIGADQIANNSLTGAQVNESSLEGLLSFGSAIPSGATIMGGWGISDDSNAVNGKVYLAINFPFPAPVALTDGNVNFAPNAAATDDDPACTGDDDSPSAPPGKVCIYIGGGVVSADGFSGGSLFGGPELNRNGFFIVSQDAATPRGFGSWAYTAP
jgi:hypothetical protein